MSDIKLFRVFAGRAIELQGDASDLEKPLQNLIEANLEALLGIRFLATEYSTGKTHGGRIDTLGLDENNCPAILEYKRSTGENVINQGLFYLDWLMDHKAEFKLLVLEKFGKPASDAIDWSAPRLVCIAADFTRYDGHAVQQINRNIELIPASRTVDFIEALGGAIPISAASASCATFRELYVRREHVSESYRGEPAHKGMLSIPELAKELRLKQEVAYHLLQVGLIRSVVRLMGRRPARFVEISELIRFQAILDARLCPSG